MNELSIYAKILIGLNMLSLIIYPALMGREKPRETYNFTEWVVRILGFIFLLLAFDII